MSDRREDERPDEHRPATNAVAQSTENRREKELHREERGNQEAEDRRTAADGPRVERQEGDDNPEPDQVHEDREQHDKEGRALQRSDLGGAGLAVRSI